MNNHIYINESIKKAVENHLIGNLLIKNTQSPLILGIFGPPGEGKTFQINEICKNLNINQKIISPGELESAHSGHPGELIRKLYLEAGSKNDTENNSLSSVLIINDIDTILGNWGELVQYTVNRQVVNAQLMALCDFPTTVNNHPTKRIPIIFTGNNPSSLYNPLLRQGRMRVISWKPGIKEKAPIVSKMFNDMSLESTIELLNAYPDEPLSFWSDVIAYYWENQLAEWIKNRSHSQLKQDLKYRTEYHTKNETIQLQEIIEISEFFKKNNIRSKSYL